MVSFHSPDVGVFSATVFLNHDMYLCMRPDITKNQAEETVMIEVNGHIPAQATGVNVVGRLLHVWPKWKISCVARLEGYLIPTFTSNQAE